MNSFAGFNISDSSVSFALSQVTPWFMAVLVIAIICAAPIKPLTMKIRNMDGTLTKSQRAVQIALYLLSFVLLAFCIMRLSGSSYNPFIYFRF